MPTKFSRSAKIYHRFQFLSIKNLLVFQNAPWELYINKKFILHVNLLIYKAHRSKFPSCKTVKKNFLHIKLNFTFALSTYFNLCEEIVIYSFFGIHLLSRAIFFLTMKVCFKVPNQYLDSKFRIPNTLQISQLCCQVLDLLHSKHLPRHGLWLGDLQHSQCALLQTCSLTVLPSY